MGPMDRGSGQGEPNPQFVVLGRRATEPAGCFQGAGRQCHPRPAQVGRPAEVRPGELHHPVACPVAERRGEGQRRGIRVGDIQITLHDLVPGIQHIGQVAEETGGNPVVCIEDEQRGLSRRRVGFEEPPEQCALSGRSRLPLGDHRPGRLGPCGGVVGTSIRQHPQIDEFGRVRLATQVGHDLVDDRSLVVGGDDHQEPAVAGSGRRGRRRPPTGQSGQQCVADEDDSQHLGNQCQSP